MSYSQIKIQDSIALMLKNSPQSQKSDVRYNINNLDKNLYLPCHTVIFTYLDHISLLNSFCRLNIESRPFYKFHTIKYFTSCKE